MNRAYTTILIGLFLLLSACSGKNGNEQGQASESGDRAKEESESVMNVSTPSLQTIPFATITGDTTNLAAYAGKVLLLVNVASECGYTPQYEGLEALYETYEDSGLVVIGFPANNFGEQEPGTDKEIFEFCKMIFGVKFPMMSKISVKGEDKHPLFVALTETSAIPGEIRWNFCKFLLDRSGNLVARYDSDTEPLSDELVFKIKSLLEAH